MCQELKDSMQVAIDQFNNELEASQTQEGHHGGEEHVKTIAHMFKLINMQEEGMRFYSNFIMLGKHMFKSYSKHQKVLALSSAQAETYGMVACSAELLGIQSCARDMGLVYDGTIFADASAAPGIVMRRGIGKVRHIRTQSLWLQESNQSVTFID